MTDKAHILVVDDEAEMRDLLQEYLGRQEFEISTAESVPAARAALDAMAGVRAVDLVILDLKMPGRMGSFRRASFGIAVALRSSCSPFPEKPSTGLSGWRSAPTTTSPNPLIRGNSWPGFGASCAESE